MTAEEFQEQRVLIIVAIKLSEEVLPAPPSSESVLARMARGRETIASGVGERSGDLRLRDKSWSDRLAALLNIKVPAWQVALGTVVAGIMLFPMFDRDKINTEVATPYVAIIDTISEHVINPILNSKDSNNLFAIGAKLVDSNYLRVSDYNRTRQRKDVNTEMLLSLTPIEL